MKPEIDETLEIIQGFVFLRDNLWNEVPSFGTFLTPLKMGKWLKFL